MAIRYGYFDSEITGVDENGMPVFDRAETSDLFRLLFSKLVSSGVLASPADCFQVLADTGLTVRIRPGFAMINGAFAYDSAESTITLAAADANLPRLDRVVLRCNYLNRLCEIITKTGTPASTPTAPELLQPTSGDYYELGLATIRVEAAATSVTQSSIVDTRADSSACGYITQLIDHLDTSTFMIQLTTWYEEYTAQCQTTLTEFYDDNAAEFTTWFNAMKDQLTTDAAGNLQTQINTLSGTVSSQASIVSGHTSSIEGLEGRMSTAEGGITDLQGDVRSIRTDISEHLTRVDINCGAHTCAADTGTVNFDIDISSYIPHGYRAFDVRCGTTQNYQFYCWMCDFVSGTDNQTVTVRIQKRSGIGGTIHPWICVTCVKEATA